MIMKKLKDSIKWKTLQQVMKEKKALDTKESKKKMMTVAYHMFK